MLKKYWIKLLIYLNIYPNLQFPKKSLPELKQASFLLAKKYKLDNSNFDFSTKSSFLILISKDFKYKRKQFLEDISKIPGFVYEGKGSSSLGRVKYKDKIIIYIKPKEMQGGMSPGKENEIFFYDKISTYISSSTDLEIIFTSPSLSLTLENINYIYNSSNDGNNKYYKSDMQLRSKDNDITNISIKKEGGFVWESAVKRYTDVYNKFLFKAKTQQIPNLKLVESEQLENKYLMLNEQNEKPYGRIIIKGFPFYDDENIIFGSEIPKPIILERTFRDSDFICKDNILRIQVENIYQTVNDIEIQGKLPVLSFSRNMSKPYGIELKCIPENKTHFTSRANVLELQYEFLMKD